MHILSLSTRRALTSNSDSDRETESEREAERQGERDTVGGGHKVLKNIKRTFTQPQNKKKIKKHKPEGGCVVKLNRHHNLRHICMC